MKTKSQILAAAGGNHEAAFDALYSDYATTVNELNTAQTEAEKNAGDSIRARVIAEGLEPLAEAHGITLPPKGQRPAKDALATLRSEAEEAVTALGETDSHALDMMALMIDRLGLDADAFEKAFEALGDTPTEDQVTALVDATLKTVTEPLARVQELERNETYRAAADPLGYDPVKLQRIIPNLTARKAQVDGKDVTEYGIPGDGDAWTPITDAVKGWEASLKREGTTTPTPAPLPTTTRGAAPATTQKATVAEIAAQKAQDPNYSM